MAYSEAQKRATLKYKAKAYERIEVTVKKGAKEIFQKQAAKKGLSLTSYITSLIEKDIRADEDKHNI